eukprot:scaffold77596_cov36-Tisochrysis_lutea.AAC.4
MYRGEHARGVEVDPPPLLRCRLLHPHIMNHAPVDVVHEVPVDAKHGAVGAEPLSPRVRDRHRRLLQREKHTVLPHYVVSGRQ